MEKFAYHLYRIDTDDDQRISLDEMKTWLTRDAIKEAEMVDDDETSSDYHDMDTNNDMKIDVDEMIEYHKKRFR